MKKVFQILFVFLFTLITIGFTINKHYSRGELFSVALFGEPDSCCPVPCNCCDEESETIQFLVDYTFSIDNFESTPSVLEFFTVALSLTISEPDLVLTYPEIFDQDLPPPDELTTHSFYQNFLL